MESRYIFVYGTLRKNSTMHHILAQYCEYVANGYLQGRLYEIAGYPGAVESDNADDKVQGELYKIVTREEIFPRLDDYEECSSRFPEPHEYIRKLIQARLADDETVTAWAYLFNQDITGLPRIESGDYSIHIKNSK